jgi:hypothetical protein
VRAYWRELLFAAVGVVLALLPIALALVVGEPEIVRRGGSFVVAYAASMILYVAFFERSEPVAGSVASEGVVKRSASPLERLAQRVEAASERLRHREFDTRRIWLIIIHSTLAVVGELLSGFGDLIVDPFMPHIGEKLALHLVVLPLG